MPSHLPISLIVSGIVVTAVLVAVSRKKKGYKSKQENDVPSINEIDMSWLDEYEAKETSKQSKKGKKKATSSKKTPRKAVVSEGKKTDVSDASGVTESSSESEQEDGLDDIQLLAALQQKTKKSGAPQKKPAIPSTKPVVNSDEAIKTVEIAKSVEPVKPVEAPSTKEPSVTEQAETTRIIEPLLTAGVESGEWDSVPTKDELVLSSLRSRIESLGRSLESAEQSKSRAEKNLSAAQETSKRFEAELKERCQVLGVRVLSLEGELCQVRANAQLVAKRLAHVEEVEVAESKEEISRLTGILLEAEGRVNALNEERQVLLTHSHGFEEELARKTEEVSRLKETVEILQPFRPKCVSLESDLARVQQALGTTERDLISLRSQEASRAAENKRAIEEQSQKIAELNKTVAECEQKETQLKSEIACVTKDLEAAAEKTSESEALVVGLKSELGSIQAMLDDTKSQLTESKEQISSLEASKNSIETRLKSTIGEVESLRASLGESEKAQSELGARLDASTETISSLNSSIAPKEDSISALTSQVLSLQFELECTRNESTSAVEAARSELEAVKKRFAEHLVQNAGIKSRKEEVEIENGRLSAELATLKAAVFGGVKSGKTGKKVPPTTTTPSVSMSDSSR